MSWKVNAADINFINPIGGNKNGATSADWTAAYDGMLTSEKYPRTYISFIRCDGPQDFTSGYCSISMRTHYTTQNSNRDFMTLAYYRDLGESDYIRCSAIENFASTRSASSAMQLPYSNKWYMFASVYISKTSRKSYIIDPEDGTVLGYNLNTEVTNFGTLSTFSGGQPPYFLATGNFFPDFYFAEIDMWEDELSQSELQAFSQVGFAELNRPTNLVLSWNFMRDWKASGAVDSVDDAAGSDANLIIPSSLNNASNFSTSNPVPVFIISPTGAEHDLLSFSLFSATAGTAKAAAYPTGTPQPSDADIFNGVGAVATGSAVLDGVGDFALTLTGLDTGTTYDIFFIQDEDDLGTYNNPQMQSITTPTKYSEIITNIEGNETLNLSNIKYKWYDSTDLSALGSSTADGTTEVTDGTGLLEITLPDGVTTTAKGSQGTMMLQVDDGGTIKTAYHIATVK